jgi:hypothetical protein
VLVGIKVKKELVDLVKNFFGTSVATVDLVENDNGGQPSGEGLRQHVSGLWERPFSGVDEEDDTVHHCQRPFYLATKIGMARGVDEIDVDPVPVHGGSLSKNRDSAFALLIVGVHDSVDDGGVVTKRTGGSEERIDESRLAMVDVGDKGNVAKWS